MAGWWMAAEPVLFDDFQSGVDTIQFIPNGAIASLTPGVALRAPP